MNLLTNFIHSVYQLSLEMAPYLLFGFFVAGVLKIFLPKEILYRHLTKNNLGSVLKASLLGVPLPICSCGVIPVAAHLKKEGARNGPLLSFLTSTPTSGVDSLLATYSLLGPIFAFARAISAFILGILSGVIGNIFDRQKNQEHSSLTPTHTSQTTLKNKIVEIMNYAFIELIADIAKWLIIGIIAGALLNVFIPQNFVANYLNSPVIAYFIMIIIGIPLYVCATGSIPIAATFLTLGISPGATLVFLLVGPATNTATIAFVTGKMGKKALLIYLATIIFSSLIVGIGFDFILQTNQINLNALNGHTQILPLWIKQLSTLLLYALLLWSILKKLNPKKQIEGTRYSIPSISCINCANKISSALSKHQEIKNFSIDIKSKSVTLQTNCDQQELENLFKSIGFPIKRN